MLRPAYPNLLSMMRALRIIVVLALAVPLGALAQENPTRIEMVPPSDTPGASVPLRDFIASQIERIEKQHERDHVAMDRRFLELLNERDRLFTQRFDLTDKQVGFAFTAAAQAAEKADAAQGLRNIVSNEFRGTIEDQAQTYARRESVDVQFSSVADRLDRLTNVISELDKRIVEINSKGAGAQLFWQIAAGFIVVVGVVFGIVFGLRRDRLPERTRP